MDFLRTYFNFEDEDDALDYAYRHLDTELKAGNYELVDGYLRDILDTKEYWDKGILQPIYSLAFAMYTHHEPEKFKNRQEFMIRLHTDYVSTHGAIRAGRLLIGLMKDIIH